jgi:hypothetical protein
MRALQYEYISRQPRRKNTRTSTVFAQTLTHLLALCLARRCWRNLRQEDASVPQRPIRDRLR